MMNHFTCSEFVRRRDKFQRERRETDTPVLLAAFEAAKAAVAPLQRQYKSAEKHDREIIMNELKPLLWAKQDTWAELQTITGGKCDAEW
jgi:hypothetical protein